MSQAPRTRHRLLFGSMELIPVGSTELWYVPGGGTATTKELIRRAEKRGIQVSRLTTRGLNRKLETLN